jgi:hypothetical protein
VNAVDLDEFRLIMDRAVNSSFRLETRPQYLVPQEEEALAKWRAGIRELKTPETTEWLARIRRDTERGFRWYRVHILDYPLCEYSEFELHAYQANRAAGEEIYIADRAWSKELQDLHEDFWLADDKIAIRMVYDEEGHFLRPEAINDVTPYLEIRDRTLRHAVELNEYLKKREPRLIA